MSYADEYDDSDLVDISPHPPSNIEGSGATGASSNTTGKHVRRRSSKACTFLGPSRKRGPPKGYIDAIEARLHQTEALLGIMISTSDPRAQSLLRDIAKDPLAKEIINRVDNSPYGVKGRKRTGGSGKPRVGADHHASGSESSQSTSQRTGSANIDITSTHPSNEWQDQVSAILHTLPQTEDVDVSPDAPPDSHRLRPQTGAPPLSASYSGRRTRRRVGTEDVALHLHEYAHLTGSTAISHRDSPLGRYGYGPEHREPYMARRRWSVSSADSASSANEELTGAVGQLSLNEDEQVRYHGKASGLHLLGNKERLDARNEGGIWRFPKARVWPPLQSSVSAVMNGVDEYASQLPDQSVQDHLLDLYFKFVQPILPVIHKRAFYDAYTAESPRSPEMGSGSPFNRRRRRVPTLLLLAMYATAARYSELTPKPTDASMMWEAGDEYLNQAKVILDGTYAASRPSTCQALLLMGYREIGIGAMAQAWTYIGMAIRMAQDLGMHRSADGWARVDLGGRLFGEWELHERKRIWFTCVIMDKYVSTYIAIYAVRPASSRHAESKILEASLDKWYIELPPHLRYDPGSTKRAVPPPHVLTLHMQYWCAVLLLHRPFIRNDLYPSKKTPEEFDDVEGRALAEKSHELCAGAANHITSIATLYSEVYTLDHCANFLCYYVFTASIMHVTDLTAHPTDPQARMGLSRCMDVFRMMEVLWPSAGRALELLRGSKVNMQDADLAPLISATSRPKRSAEYPLNDAFDRSAPPDPTTDQDYLELRPPYTPQYDSNTAYTSTGHEIHSHPQESTPNPPAQVPYVPSYDRWPSENLDGSSHGFSGALSTSVLPQLYSTGLVDDRHSSAPHRVQVHNSDQARTNRYPQYWNDFSTFPQLGTAYGGYQQASILPQQPPHQQHYSSAHMHLAESYSLYSKSLKFVAVFSALV
ncbi:hypothetical protein DXG03_007558 [Asterophora parasitica]|uniref:Xylanolytic transcriptional activator regulatory domain-containing protein n=1 Tax=Asterophora parasitica TaxID=117018 RepID=A0A9P7KBR8_9AGAR|nr:hypothetical protein DXG03_007558 [Asterophora parasitica]